MKMDEKVIQIEGKDYSEHIVDAYLKSVGGQPADEPKTYWFESEKLGLKRFSDGFQYGYETASSEAPDCDDCDVHGKAAERGPPESHRSQQDR